MRQSKNPSPVKNRKTYSLIHWHFRVNGFDLSDHFLVASVCRITRGQLSHHHTLTFANVWRHLWLLKLEKVLVTTSG